MTFASVFGEIILGWLLADLLTGIYHWWQDRIAKPTWPILGSWLVAPAQLHHAEPLVFTLNTFMQRNRASIIAAAVIAALWWWAFGPSVCMVMTAVGGALSNEVHRYTHEPRKAHPILRVMQDIGIIQSPKGHSRHHRPPQTTDYFPLTDWLNPIAEAIDLWPRLERLFDVHG